VQVEEVDGINALREFNSVDGPQPGCVNLLFQKIIDRSFTKTTAHPWYNGIPKADTFMKDHFPELWNLVLLKMVQDKHE
jgi:hypothetical protein